MQVLSWNLQGSAAARTALWDHLNALQEPEVVVCLQEWATARSPRPSWVDIDEEVKAELGGRFHVGALRISHAVSLVTLVRDTLAARPQAGGDPQRACVCHIGQAGFGRNEWTSGRELTVVNIHQPSRLHRRSLEDREDVVVSLKEALLSCLVQPVQRTVLVGDWNAEPHAPELWQVRRLNASRQRRVHGSTKKPGGWPTWYNPSWQLLSDRAEAANAPIGTYYFDKSHEVPDRWKVFDQIILSQDLAEAWDDHWRISLRPDLSLHTPLLKGAPPATALSDHVPVQLSFPVP